MSKKKRKQLFCLFLTVLMVISDVQWTKAATPLFTSGQLSVEGTKIVDESGNEFVMKGVSMHGLSWFPEYGNKKALKELRDKWGVNTIRIPIYTMEYNGYCNSGDANRKKLRGLVEQIVSDATSLGLYVIVDWHILSDGNPLTYRKRANYFFQEISKKFKNNQNVIYEICNEPNGSKGTWNNIKSYANPIIRTIRKNQPNAVIIVGTPNWSQDVDVAAKSPLGFSNIAYAFHFYAGTHKAIYRDKLKTAIKAGLPVVVTEFGLSDSSGSGSLNIAGGNTWMKLLDQYKIGRVCWNLSNKQESCALIKSSCKKTSGWIYTNLSAQGKWLVKKYGGSICPQ